VPRRWCRRRDDDIEVEQFIATTATKPITHTTVLGQVGRVIAWRCGCYSASGGAAPSPPGYLEN
jgi:hypothetical protein